MSDDDPSERGEGGPPPPAAGSRGDGSRVAVVSGAGSGIGREIALELGRRGFALALLGRRPAPLEATLAAAGLPASAGGLAMPCDVRDGAAVARAAAAVEARWGAADLVVPAAGAAHIRPFAELSVEGFATTVETNLTGVFLLLHALLPAMRRRGRGWIFAILSVAARRGFPGWAAYCASKWGLAGLLAALREELAGSGVRLTSIYPGATDTPIWEAVPGEWDRAVMVPPAEVARAVGCALDADPRALVEEIHLGPAGGAL
jgi:NAD(P)-dependent dehydrogenase (short-subunit alcohol dehydrogenase family)